MHATVKEEFSVAFPPFHSSFSKFDQNQVERSLSPSWHEDQ